MSHYSMRNHVLTLFSVDILFFKNLALAEFSATGPQMMLLRISDLGKWQNVIVGFLEVPLCDSIFYALLT